MVLLVWCQFVSPDIVHAACRLNWVKQCVGGFKLHDNDDDDDCHYRAHHPTRMVLLAWCQFESPDIARVACKLIFVGDASGKEFSSSYMSCLYLHTRTNS